MLALAHRLRAFDLVRLVSQPNAQRLRDEFDDTTAVISGLNDRAQFVVVDPSRHRDRFAVDECGSAEYEMRAVRAADDTGTIMMGVPQARFASIDIHTLTQQMSGAAAESNA